MNRRLAFLRWLQLGAVRQPHRYYQDAMTPCSHPAALRFLRLAVPRLHSLCSLLDGRVRRRGLELVTRYLRPGSCRGSNRISQVPGEPPLSVCTCSATPTGLHAPDRYGVAAWPLVCEQQRLPRKVFRRSIAWLSDSLSTHHQVRYLLRRKTRFRPLVRRYRTGFPPEGSLRKVSDLLPYISSPFPKLAWRNCIDFAEFVELLQRSARRI